MCLALYGNGMLRLWNMLDGRCIFKKKVGIPESDGDGDQKELDEDSYESNNNELGKNLIASKFSNTPSLIKWDPYQG